MRTEGNWQNKNDCAFILDEKYNLYHLEVAKECIPKKVFRLTQNLQLASELDMKIQSKDFVRLSITERCLSFYGKTISLETYHTWTLEQYTESEDKVEQ